MAVELDKKASAIESQKKNLRMLQELENLPPNWNGYGASPVDSRILDHARHLLQSFPVQPSMIVPTGRGTVQLEYEQSNGKYLELDVGGVGIDILYQPIDDQEIEEEGVSDERAIEFVHRYHAE